MTSRELMGRLLVRARPLVQARRHLPAPHFAAPDLDTCLGSSGSSGALRLLPFRALLGPGPGDDVVPKLRVALAPFAAPSPADSSAAAAAASRAGRRRANDDDDDAPLPVVNSQPHVPLVRQPQPCSALFGLLLRLFDGSAGVGGRRGDRNRKRRRWPPARFEAPARDQRGRRAWRGAFRGQRRRKGEGQAEVGRGRGWSDGVCAGRGGQREGSGRRGERQEEYAIERQWPDDDDGSEGRRRRRATVKGAFSRCVVQHSLGCWCSKDADAGPPPNRPQTLPKRRALSPPSSATSDASFAEQALSPGSTSGPFSRTGTPLSLSSTTNAAAGSRSSTAAPVVPGPTPADLLAADNYILGVLRAWGRATFLAGRYRCREAIGELDGLPRELWEGSVEVRLLLGRCWYETVDYIKVGLALLSLDSSRNHASC